MKRYIALLRGINISGKNKIAMSELKRNFVELGFIEVVTYLNSGNVIFSSELDDMDALSNKVEEMIKDKFDLEIPVLIILQEDLKEVLTHAPDWWGNEYKETYDNLILIFPPFSFNQIYDEIGAPKAEYEKIYNYKNAIFWSFSLKYYQKTNWWPKTASTGAAQKITIRTANTVRKIANI